MEKKSINIDCKIVVSLLIFSIFFVFFNSKNSPLYQFNEWGDVNIYFSIGKGIMNGLVPYKDIFDHKGPLIFFLYGIAYLVSDTSFLGVYVLECVALFINIIFAFKIGRLYLNKVLSYVVALAYAVFLFNKSYYGGSAEEFISVFVTISFYYFIVYFTQENRTQKEANKQMLIHGIMFTLTFLSKLSICVFWVPLILAIFADLLYQKEYRKMLKNAIYFLIGCFATLLPFVLYFVFNNAFDEAYFGYITFNSIYAEFTPDLNLMRKILAHVYKLITNDYISFSITLLGMFLLSFTNKYIKSPLYKAGMILSFILSFVVICLSKYIMTYAHIVIYVYAIFGMIFLAQSIAKYLKPSYNPYIYSLSFIVLLGMGIYNKKLYNQDIDCLMRKKECNYMQKEFAEIINKEKNPTLLNIGLDLGVYTKANIVPSYKYFFYPNIPYHLFPDVMDYQKELIVKKEPMFIVMGDKSAHYNFYKTMPELHENYDLISTFHQNIQDFDTEVYLFKRK